MEAVWVVVEWTVGASPEAKREVAEQEKVKYY